MNDINVKMAELDEATVRPGVVMATIEDLKLTDKHIIIELTLPLGESLKFPVERPQHYWSDDIDFVKFLSWYDYSSSNLSTLPGEQILVDMSGDEPSIMPPSLKSTDDWMFNVTEPAVFLWSIVFAGALTGVVGAYFGTTLAQFGLIDIIIASVGSAITFFVVLGAILIAGVKLANLDTNTPEIEPVSEPTFDQEDITDYADKEKVLA